MDSIGEVASANRVSPRPVSEERRTDSGAETAIVAPDLAAVKAAKQAVVNAAGSTLMTFELFYHMHHTYFHQSVTSVVHSVYGGTHQPHE